MMLYRVTLPSHFASSSTLMGSSLGGSSFGGFLGVNFLGSSTCPLSFSAIVGVVYGFAGFLCKRVDGVVSGQSCWVQLEEY